MGNFAIGVLFLNEHRDRLVNRLSELQADYQMQQVNDKWSSLMLEGQSIEDERIQRLVRRLSHTLPMAYYTLEEAGFEYQIYNCGEKIASFKQNMTFDNFKANLDGLLAESNPAAWGLFDVGNDQVMRLTQLFARENLIDEMALNNAIVSFKDILELRGLSWHNGRCVAGNEIHRVVSIHNSPFIEKVEKSDISDFGKPGFWKILLLMWKEPRRVARYILETDYEYWALRIIAVSGAIEYFIRFRLDDKVRPLLYDVVFGVLAGVIGGVCGLYLTSALVKWTGKWINGKADFNQIKAITGWCSLITVVNIFLSMVVQIILFGGHIYYIYPSTSLNEGSATYPHNFPLFIIFTFILAIVAVVISCKMLGEAQGFSALRALANYVLTVVVAFGFTFIILLTIGLPLAFR